MEVSKCLVNGAPAGFVPSRCLTVVLGDVGDVSCGNGMDVFEEGAWRMDIAEAKLFRDVFLGQSWCYPGQCEKGGKLRAEDDLSGMSAPEEGQCTIR